MKPVEKFPHMADIVHQIQAMSDYAKTGKVSGKIQTKHGAEIFALLTFCFLHMVVQGL